MRIKLPGNLGQITGRTKPVRPAATAAPTVCLDPIEQARAIETVLNDIRAERQRQLDQWGVQHRRPGTGAEDSRRDANLMRLRCQRAEEAGGAAWSDVLLEEVFEALAEVNTADLRQELVQVAAVCAAWVEDIDSARHSAAAPF